jgi:uncharacterized phage protein (predicted DNA packaging)
MAEIVTLAEAKAHLRVDTADDDALITGLVEAATEMVESWLSRDLYDAASTPRAIKVAITMIVAHWYINTEAVAPEAMTQLPIGIDDMLSPYRVVMV